MSVKVDMIKDPDYIIDIVPVTDSQGNQEKDQYGHPLYRREYDNFPTYTRKCPECEAVYRYRYPDLIELGDRAKLGINGLGLGFLCPNCGAMIVHWGDSSYNVEDPPRDDRT